MVRYFSDSGRNRTRTNEPRTGYAGGASTALRVSVGCALHWRRDYRIQEPAHRSISRRDRYSGHGDHAVSWLCGGGSGEGGHYAARNRVERLAKRRADVFAYAIRTLVPDYHVQRQGQRLPGTSTGAGAATRSGFAAAGGYAVG